MKELLQAVGNALKQPTTLAGIVAGAAYFGVKVDSHTALTVMDLIVSALTAALIVYDETKNGVKLSAAIADAVGPVVTTAINDVLPAPAAAVVNNVITAVEAEVKAAPSAPDATAAPAAAPPAGAVAQ
jgi:uncharacterized membrane protein